MRILLSTIAIGSLVATWPVSPAFAQVDGFGHAIKEKKPVEYHQPARNDRAYKSALDQIPDSKQKYDPWGNVRQQPSGSANQPK
jgi:hypothetical protein